jgi:two-component system, cell cycle sensor histidine kinase and response regulator CckA
MAAATTMEDSSSTQKAAEVSLSLIRAKSESLDRAIESALGTICSAVGAVRGSLFCLSDDRQTMTITHEWSRDPEDGEKGPRKGAPPDCFDPYRADLLAGKSVVVVPTPAVFRREGDECGDGSAAGRPCRCVFFPLGIESELCAIVGMYGNAGLVADWTDSAVELLGRVKDALANTVMRIQSERALRLSVERLSESDQRCQVASGLLIDYSFRLAVAPDGTVSMDYVTDNFFAITGRSREEAATVDTWSQFVHPEDLGRLHSLLERLIRQPRQERIECRSVVHGNTQRWIEVAAKSEWDESESRVAHIIGAVKDITERKRAEEALRLREYYLTAIIENQPGLVWLKDADSRFLAVNRAFARSCGKQEPEELIGRTDLDVWPKELAEQYRKDDAAVLKNGVPVRVEELISDKGERTWFETFKTPVKNTRGEIIGTTGYAHDITERKREEEALRNVQKLESLGILAGGIAHDFNNLLGGIFGYIDLAVAKASAGEVADTLAKALATIDRARGLTRQLLTFAKGGAPIKKTESLIPSIQEAARFALSGSRVSCDFHVPADLWLCEFDKEQIGQVIDNIVINAQQAMPDGGTIDICAENVSTATKPSGPAPKAGHYVRVSVIDHGIGMPQEIIPRIFDPFFTTKAKGHGLGLATCHSIVHRHGGWIDVESEPGEGSTFHVYLPANPGLSRPEAAASAAASHEGRGTIVVMDDEEVIRDAVSEMLKSLGYSVITTQNGREAIDVARGETQAGRTIEAMILDMTVPGGMGGREAVGEIHRIDPRLPVFVASGYAADPVMATPKDHGFAGSICKPFTRSDLAEMLRKGKEE